MGKNHILLIEDDEDLAQLTGMLLQSHGYQVDIAYNGSDAFKKIRQDPELILLDTTLPDIECAQICQKIRKNKELADVPIIVLTVHRASVDKIEGLYIDIDDQLTKPFSREEILAKIEVALQQKKAPQKARRKEQIVLRELKRTLKHELVIPFFQPIYSLTSLVPIGVEALSRPLMGIFLNNPEFFFKAALTFGLYAQIEVLCWRKAISAWKETVGQGRLFLNCTPYFLGSTPLKKKFFLDLNVDPSCLVFELTERTAIQDYNLLLSNLMRLQKMGVKIAVDDVGSGYATLDAVAEIKPDFVKIDMSLVRDIHKDALKQDLVQSITFFCRKYNIITIAEGIEKTEELKTMKELGADAAQGYFLGKPSPQIPSDIFSKKAAL